MHIASKTEMSMFRLHDSLPCWAVELSLGAIPINAIGISSQSISAGFCLLAPRRRQRPALILSLLVTYAHHFPRVDKGVNTKQQNIRLV